MFRNKGKGSAENPKRDIDYLGSVSDLMSALLFIFIITLLSAVILLNKTSKQYQEKEQRALVNIQRLQELEVQTKRQLQALEILQSQLQWLQTRMDGADRARRQILIAIRKDLQQKNLSVSKDASRGVLYIPEDVIGFKTGSARLDARNFRKVQILSQILAKHMYCYASNNVQDSVCQKVNPNRYQLDAVFIEGHTDNQQYWGDKTGFRNRELATNRSNVVYDILVRENKVLQAMRNTRNESIFSISGYGDMRPVAGHEHTKPTNDAANRRIELRFLFRQPRFDEVDKQMLAKSQEIQNDLKKE